MEIDKILKTAFSVMPYGEHRLEWFSQVKQGNSSKILNIQASPPQVPEMKTWRKFAKSLLNTGGTITLEIDDRLGLLHVICQQI